MRFGLSLRQTQPLTTHESVQGEDRIPNRRAGTSSNSAFPVNLKGWAASTDTILSVRQVRPVSHHITTRSEI